MLKLNRNIRVQVGSKSRRRVSVIDNGSDRVYTFDENGLHHLGEQYQLPPTQLNVNRRSASGNPLVTARNTDYVSLGAVGYSYWLAPIANKQGGYFDFARLEKGNVLTIYRRDGDDKVVELTTADLMGGVHPFINITQGGDRLYGNAQLFKISNSQYYLSGAQHLDIGETIPQTGIVTTPGVPNGSPNALRGVIPIYDLLNVNNGVSSATKLTQSGTFTVVDGTNVRTTAESVVCPTAITYLGNIQGFDVMLQSNATNAAADDNSLGPVIALVEINTLGQFGGVRFVSYGQSYRIVRLQGNTIREVAFARNDNTGAGKPFPNQIGSNLPAVTTGREDQQIYFDPNLIGNVAPVQPAAGVGVSGFPSIAGLDAFAVIRIGDRYVLNKTTFPSQSNPSTLAVINAPITSPIAELPTNTFDAFYCNTMLYNAAGKGIDCHLYVTEGGSRQETRIQTQSPVSGGGGEIVTRPSSDSLTGYLRGIRVNEITLPMSFIADDVIYDIDSIDDVNNQTIKVEFSQRRL